MKVGTLAESVGKGLLAGLVGTAAMTASSTLEAKLTKREPSDAPAEAASKVLGVEPEGETEKQRFSQLVHWAYGTGWGAVRGMLAAFGLGPVSASAAHFGVVWGAELVTLPALRVAPPVTEWDAQTIGTDVLHHAVYAIAAGAAYHMLDRNAA